MTDLPTSWEWAELSEVCTSIADGDHQAPPQVSSGVPFLVIGNIRSGQIDFAGCRFVPDAYYQSLKAIRRPQRGDVLYSLVGSYGIATPVMNDRQFCVQRHIGILRPSPSVSTKFLFHVLSGRDVFDQATQCATGTAQLTVPLTGLRRIRIPLPPRAEQDLIVASIEEQFSRVDRGVSSLEQARRKLGRARRAVLLAAVTGRLVPQDDAEGSGADLLGTIQAVGPRRSSQHGGLVTDLPTLPPNWSTAAWSKIGYSQNGRSFPSADYSSTGVHLLRPGNLHVSGKIVWNQNNTRCMPKRYSLAFPGHVVRGGEIVMNLTAQSLKDEFLGRVCMTSPEEEPALLNQRLARLTPVGIDARYVFYVLKSPIFRRFVDQLHTGSLIQHMFTSQLDQFVFPIPPLKEQVRIVRALESYIGFFDVLDESLVSAKNRAILLRRSVLEAAFSGGLI